MDNDRERDPQQFLEALESATLEGPFRHQDHVWAAWLMLREGPLEEVLVRYTRAIQNFAAARGAHGLYHQTITWTYLFAIQERMAALDDDHDWPAFRDAYPELFEDHRRFLGRYFTEDVLSSDLARHNFLLPNRGLQDAA